MKPEQDDALRVKLLLITGDRHGFDLLTMERWIRALNPPEIIVGDANGVDAQVATIAEGMGIKPEVFVADWAKEGRLAGPIRNAKMLNRKPDIVLAFHYDISKSRGTADCLKQAAEKGITTILVSKPLIDRLTKNDSGEGK